LAVDGHPALLSTRLFGKKHHPSDAIRRFFLLTTWPARRDTVGYSRRATMPTRVVLTVAMCAVVLWAAAAFAQPSPQDKCNAALITGWKLYLSCLEGAVAKEAKSVFINDFAVFTRCRSTYFKRWTHLQANPALATSTCQPADGLRLVDNMDGTITDNLT